MRCVTSRVSLCALLVKIELRQSVTTSPHTKTNRAGDSARNERTSTPPGAGFALPTAVALTRPAPCSEPCGEWCVHPRYPSSILTVPRNR